MKIVEFINGVIYISCKIVKKINEPVMTYFWPEVTEYVCYFMNLKLNSTQRKIHF